MAELTHDKQSTGPQPEARRSTGGGGGAAGGAKLQLKKAAGQAGFVRGSQMLSATAGALNLKSDGSGGGIASKADAVARASEGVSGAGGALPHADRIQESFGHHDVSSVKAHVGGSAGAAASDLGAQAYATGDNVAFKSAPDLHTAAHEAAHVVQQRSGVQLKGDVGKAGDSYERHADAVADTVVAGKSAAPLLDSMAGAGKSAPMAGGPVQFLGYSLTEDLPEGAERPAHLDRTGKQRRYTPEQYIKMWEEERGRKMTDAERKTLARGCIGIVALNTGTINPPLDHVYDSFDKAKQLADTWNAYIKENADKNYGGGKLGDYEAVLFAKLFWSNQSPDWEERKKPDPDAYKADPKTGRVDMTGYKYRAQTKPDGKGTYINFDYGYWDDSTQTIWHANHAEPGMQVYQSTRAKFEKGYIDFDRLVWGVAVARKFDRKAAARNG